MAVEAIHALLSVGGHLVFMHNRVLKPRMTFCALSRRPDKVSRGLGGLNGRTLSIDKERGQNERKCSDYSQKYRTKRHGVPPGNNFESPPWRRTFACMTEQMQLYQSWRSARINRMAAVDAFLSDRCVK